MTIYDSKSLHTLLVEILISSNHEHGWFHNLSDLTLHIIFDGWWHFMNVGAKHHVGWNISSHAPSWRFYWHCGIWDTSNLVSYVLFVIKLFAIHQRIGPAQWGNTWWQLHTSQCWMSWQSQKLLNQLRQMPVEQLWPYWKVMEVKELPYKVRKGNSYSAFKSYLYGPCRLTQCSKLASKDFVNAEFH